MSQKRNPRQQTLDALAESEKSVAERRLAQARPEEKIEAKAIEQAVAAADELSTEGVVKSISELRSVIGKTLSQLSDRLEEQVARYVQIQRAVLAKEAELKDIYEIQRAATTLTALIESHERQREELEGELAEQRRELEQEIEGTRAEWEREQKQREAEGKERDAAEQKRRQREQDEYRYTFAREQQQAKDAFADQTATAAKELADRKSAAERDLTERQRALLVSEAELASLRQRAEAFPRELESAMAKAVMDAVSRQQQESAGREELLKREYAGEKNVLTTRITSLEQTVKQQAEQIARLLGQAEKAYGQVQEIAVCAIEGSAGAKQLANLQQMLAEQSHKPTTDR